ncbi:MAG: EAL domain-containing protein [Gammaproteobacteria bacterium]
MDRGGTSETIGLIPSVAGRQPPVRSNPWADELQPDYVRLDRTCLAIGDSPAALARAMTLIALLHESGAKVIIHGLETTAQVRGATECGVDVAAGDHFGRPSPDLSNGVLVPANGSRPFGSRTAAGTPPFRAGDVFLRYA